MNRTHAIVAAAFAAATGVSSAQVVLNFDFDASNNPLPAGTIVTNQFQHLGVTVSANNSRSSGPDAAIIFDSANPTGGDADLRTPGIGLNDRPLGNILIIAEDIVDQNNDNLVDDPDDEARGGRITFDLDFLANAATFRLIDIEEHGGTISFYNDSVPSFTPVAMLSINPTGNNNAVDLAIDNIEFDRIKVRLSGSGGIGEINITPTPTPATAALLGLAGLCAAKRRRA
ncbi:MAG: hypothetical protein ACF8SC_08445 [Phycisphaerales bacterium JB037]